MSELKRCPRCGAEAHVVTEDGEPTMFLCEDCGSWLDVSEFETTENAFKWWNDRPFIDALNARISELEAAQRWIPVSEPPKECKWKAYVPGWGAPTVNKRYLVKLINDWITIATYYLHVGGGYWKDDRGQELADGVVSLWKGLEE